MREDPEESGSEKERGWERRKTEDRKQGEPECITRGLGINRHSEREVTSNTANEYIVC